MNENTGAPKNLVSVCSLVRIFSRFSKFYRGCKSANRLRTHVWQPRLNFKNLSPSFWGFFRDPNFWAFRHLRGRFRAPVLGPLFWTFCEKNIFFRALYLLGYFRIVQNARKGCLIHLPVNRWFWIDPEMTSNSIQNRSKMRAGNNNLIKKGSKRRGWTW